MTATTSTLARLALGLIALSQTSCVVVSHAEAPAPIQVEGGPRFERIRVEGFDVAVKTEAGHASSFSVGTAFGNGWSATGTRSTMTTLYQNRSSSLVEGTSAGYLEEIGLARIVERGTSPEGGVPDLVLRGSLRLEGSWWNAWSVPVNTVLGLALIFPITWANESRCTLRVYTADGEFLKAYDSAPELVRTWYYWTESVRIQASNERYLTASALAARHALDRFVRDVLDGKFQEHQKVRSEVARRRKS